MTMVLAVLLVLAPIVFAGVLVSGPSAPRTGGFAFDWSRAVALAVVLPVFADLGQKVSYRWFDCLFLLVPIYS